MLFVIRIVCYYDEIHLYYPHLNPLCNWGHPANRDGCVCDLLDSEVQWNCVHTTSGRGEVEVYNWLWHHDRIAFQT